MKFIAKNVKFMIFGVAIVGFVACASPMTLEQSLAEIPNCSDVESEAQLCAERRGIYEMIFEWIFKNGNKIGENAYIHNTMIVESRAVENTDSLDDVRIVGKVYYSDGSLAAESADVRKSSVKCTNGVIVDIEDIEKDKIRESGDKLTAWDNELKALCKVGE